MQYLTHPLYLPERDFRSLFINLGPSLGFWRGAEVAAMREAVGSCESPVLDLGCGDGLITSYILPRVDIGLDPDAPALERAARRNMYGSFLPVVMEASGLADGSLGTIISNSVLEHIPRIDDALAGAGRALKPGGRMIFTCPTAHFARSLALKGARYVEGRNRHFLHYNLWTVEEWARRLARAGLEIECVRPYMRPGWVRMWDMLDQAESVWVGRRRLLGMLWKSLPPAWLDSLAVRASRLDLSSQPPGGGQLIVARKV